MPIYNRRTRMAAVNPGCPWRGTMVAQAEPGFSAEDRAATVYLFARYVAVPAIVALPIGPVGRVYPPGNGPSRPRRLPPPRRVKKRRKKRPRPEVREPTQKEIAARRQRAAEAVAKGWERSFGEDAQDERAALAAVREMTGLGEGDGIPRVDWRALEEEVEIQQRRLIDEEEAEILLLAT